MGKVSIQSPGSQGIRPLLPFVENAMFKCKDVITFCQPIEKTIPVTASSQPTIQGMKFKTQFIGAVVKSNKLDLGQGALFESFSIYGVHQSFMNTLQGIRPILTKQPGDVQLNAQSVNDIRNLNIPLPFNQIPNFDFVFFHPCELSSLATFHSKQEFVHVSRVIVDCGVNGPKYQTLKLRPEPNPVALAGRDQISDIAYLIGNSCPPNWQPETYSLFVPTVIEYKFPNSDQIIKSRITWSLLSHLLIKDYVLIDADANPEE